MRVFLALLVIGSATPVLAQVLPRSDRGSGSPPTSGVEAPACASVRAESRPDGMSYTHLLVVENHCARPLRCELGTDADPTPVTFVVAPDQRAETITRRYSPAPVVSARGRCVET